ncbi:hypothetical protein QEN19_001709 [Hanseniaspora menglaensis]
MKNTSNSNSEQNLRQNPSQKALKDYFPENTADEDINKVILKILMERKLMEGKKVDETLSGITNDQKKLKCANETKAYNNVKQKKIHDKGDKTCSFCKKTGHQRSKCPQKLYPGLNMD